MAAGVPWTIEEGGGPLVACAVHAGNEVRPEALRAPLPATVRQRSLRLYDRFYADLSAVLARAASGARPFVVLDLHSYNHRRGGPDAPPADPAGNPEINLGTGSLDRERWGGLVDRFMADLGTVEVAGRPLDVRENVRFRGGHLSRWVHAAFPGQACCLAVEVKKFFMDERTGELDEAVWAGVQEALAATVLGVLDELDRLQAVRPLRRRASVVA